MNPGTVSLVGAGPGDPGLITARGIERLRAADVIVYDRLAHPDLLQYARPDAERVYAGKASSLHTLTQDEINAVIVERALQGKRVCRLKGGDPFVFGRGGEEAEACVAAGVPFEVVPGVTSAIAAPAYAGIPITHRDAASSFAVITGHERDLTPRPPSRSGKGENPNHPTQSPLRGAALTPRPPLPITGEGESTAEGRRDWAKIAHAADTLVFLMGVESLDQIASRLMQHGRAADTPVALIERGTWPAQRTLVSTLGAVVEDARREGFRPPAVTVVGEVVRLRETLRWFDARPLFGKRVLVTRAREQASALSDLLRERGAEPVEFPVIRIEPAADRPVLDAAVARLGEYDWVVFTSANGVRVVAERLAAAGRDARAFGSSRIAAIGPATADALGSRGLRADFVPSEFVAEAVVERWPDREMRGKRVLLPRAEEAREVLPDRLREMGAAVDVVAAYRTVRDAGAAAEIVAELESGAIHAVTFTSSSTVRNFVESVGRESAPGLLRGVCVASIGPITSATAQELGIEPDVEAAEHTIPGLVEALTAAWAQTVSREP